VPRLFVAIDLPEHIKATLSALRTGALAARWVEPANFHLTLRFIGDVDEHAAKEIEAALWLIEAPCFLLNIKGIGHFCKRTLWAGVENCPPLISLQGQVEDAIQRAGLIADTSRYVPHVKLARLKWRGGAQLRVFLDGRANFAADAFEVAGFSLIESCLSKLGATHHHRAYYPLHPIRQGIPGPSAASLRQAPK
jgi:RNA 2',3'-cyclic 3'-phosphodiesterase